MVKDGNHMDPIRSQGKIEKHTQRDFGHLTPRELLQLLTVDVHQAEKADAAHSADLLSKLSLPSQNPLRIPKDEEFNIPVIPARLETDAHLHLPAERHGWQIPTEPLNRPDWSTVDTMGLPITDGDMRSLGNHNRIPKGRADWSTVDTMGLPITSGDIKSLQFSKRINDRGGNRPLLSSKKAPHPKKTLKASLIVAGNCLLIMVILISAAFVELVLLSGSPTYQIVVFVLLVIILSNILGGTVKHYSQVGIDKFKTSMHLRAVKRADAHLKASQTLRSLQRGDTTAYLRALKGRFSYRETKR